MTVLEAQIANNLNIILSFYQKEVKQNSDWYYKESLFITTVSEMFDIRADVGKGIYAAFSPLKSVEQNRKIFFQFLLSGGNSAPHMKSCVNKAALIYKLNNIRNRTIIEKSILEILNGFKTQQFFLALNGDNGAVTVDRHIFKLLPPGYRNTEKNARLIKKVFLDCPKPITAKELQAGVWGVLREEKSMSNIVSNIKVKTKN